MNYIRELNAFRDWLMLNQLNTSGVALWHTLMSVNNMAGWKEWFTAPNSTLQQLTKLSKQGLVDARNELKVKSLIDYKQGSKKQAGSYKIISLVNSFDQKLDQTLDLSLDQTEDQHLTIIKHKQKETKQDTGGRVFELYQNEGFGIIGPTVSEKLGVMIDTYGEEWVCDAIKVAVGQGKRRVSYIDGILKRWHTDGRDKEKPKIKSDIDHIIELNRRKANENEQPVGWFRDTVNAGS